MKMVMGLIKANKRIRFIVGILTFMLCWSLSDAANAAVPEKIRIGVVANTGSALYKNASMIKFTVQGEYQVFDLAALPGLDLMGEVQEGSSWQVAYLTTGIQVLRDGEPVGITAGPVAVREVSHSDGNLVKLLSYSANGASETLINKRYRGDMEFRLGSGHLLGVNELPLEEYLYGVVPREMSSSWPLEALKAQALSARTYAVANYNKRLSLGFNLLDTPDDQAYGGYNSEGVQSTKAVQQTAGEIIVYEGKPISAVYHSNSGGHTEDNENVWNAPASPYLRGKPDPYSLKNRFGNWNYVTVSQGVDQLGRAGVEEKIKSIDPQFGTLAGFQLDKYPSGRVRKVVISDTSGYTIEKTGSEFGKLFNPNFYTFLNEESFMSNFFDIILGNSFTVVDATRGPKTINSGMGLMAVNEEGSPAVINASQVYAIGAEGTKEVDIFPGKITFAGHGWGHGVGMSQWGAYQMAVEGKEYQDIIKFYYTGVEIKKN